MNHLEASRIAGAATPGDPKADIQEARKISLGENNTNACSCTILDERLDDLIAIADLTGATLDAVVATVGRLPADTFTATIDVLSTLCAPPAPSDLPGLLREHRAATDRIAEADTDGSIESLDRQIDQIEQRIMAAPARTAAMAYAKLLAVFPEIVFDLAAPANERLRAEIEATIGGEV